MTTFQTDNQVIHFSEKFGLITKDHIILTNGISQNKIQIDDIHKINLIKQRVFYSNAVLFLLAISIISFTYFYFESEKKEMYISLTSFGLILLVYSLIHKFHLYKIVIKEKDNSIIELKSNQINRKNIKVFYNTIAKMVETAFKRKHTAQMPKSA